MNECTKFIKEAKTMHGGKKEKKKMATIVKYYFMWSLALENVKEKKKFGVCQQGWPPNCQSTNHCQ